VFLGTLSLTLICAGVSSPTLPATQTLWGMRWWTRLLAYIARGHALVAHLGHG